MFWLQVLTTTATPWVQVLIISVVAILLIIGLGYKSYMLHNPYWRKGKKRRKK